MVLLRKGFLLVSQKVSQGDNGNICTDLEDDVDDKYKLDVADTDSFSDEEDDGANGDSVSDDLDQLKSLFP